MYDDSRIIIGMSLYHPPTDELTLAGVLHALSDPRRLRIVRELSTDPTPRPCGSIELGVTKSTSTHHFRVLREAGVISQTLLGTSKLTSLRRADLDERFPGLLDAVLDSMAVPA
jgi:DNA-binding transcriptional ArsR family regulator